MAVGKFFGGDPGLCDKKSMSSPWVQSAPEIGKLRSLIALDRSHAGEARQSQRGLPLTTVAYTKPLRVRLKRRWRSDRGLRRNTWISVLVALASIALWQLPPASDAGATAETVLRATPGRLAQADAAPSALLVAPTSRSAPALRAPPDATTSVPSLPVRLGLQRADLWLRVGSARGDREARSLLEAALRERPDSAHGQAALAEACLRLGDATCARAAVDAARALRPWRGGYRALARKIDAVFARE